MYCMKKIKTLLIAMMGYGLIFGIILLVVFVLACFGGVIMHFFGFSYESVGKLMLFFVLSGVIGFPLELLASAFPKVLLATGKISLHIARVVFMILDILTTMVSMIVADHFMGSVSATLQSVFVIGVVLALLSVRDIDKFQKGL